MAPLPLQKLASADLTQAQRVYLQQVTQTALRLSQAILDVQHRQADLSQSMIGADPELRYYLISLIQMTDIEHDRLYACWLGPGS